ncbi:hypothetical protein [Defluviitalea raffinosedens]|uniref:hypothetical protein n=1 Tax=Defluviitalea raffinosedens TaxID=1450156 RepID=UPI00195E8B70|nr:hypothetical protein [Defluviitalea raffinosedens]MBM7685882.1 hypothetical protein [Defluviitalea raffinosedens]
MIPKIYPEEANIKDIAFTVEDPDVVSVFHNELTAEKKGSTKITVEVKDLNNNV